MLRAHLIVAASAAFLAASLPALAASPVAPQGGKVLAALDTNKDGFIDRSEFRVGQEALFKRLDTNHDGVVSGDEFNAALQRVGARRAATQAADPAQAQAQAAKRAQRMSRLFARVDTNKDGAISHDEYLAAGDALFARCDKNGDGRLTPGECRTRQARSQTPAAPKQQ